MTLSLDEDHHVHSRFSADAVSTLAENVTAARQRGLRSLCLAEHVRRDSTWVPEFLAAAGALCPVPGLALLTGLEAKILDWTGRLDLPDGISGTDRILIADHQFPGERGPVRPRQMRDALVGGMVTAEEVTDCLIDATVGALTVAARPQLAHLFSILPKLGLDESSVTDRAVGHLARQAYLSGALLEVNEKWASPSARTVRVFARAGVRLVAGTDSHDCRDIGAYASVRRIADAAFSGAVP